MGMDVYGKNGGYFRRNVWGWHPLAQMIQNIAPEVAKGCKHWHSNDCDGLDAAGAVALADILDAFVAEGGAKTYVEERRAQIASLPDEECKFCGGTGARTDPIAVERGMHETIVDEVGHPRFGQKGTCNACGSRGKARPSATYYDVDENDVREFSEFCRTSGGFEIC
jgi:hypothetical protein